LKVDNVFAGVTHAGRLPKARGLQPLMGLLAIRITSWPQSRSRAVWGLRGWPQYKS